MKYCQNLVCITCQLLIHDLDLNHVYRGFILKFPLNYSKTIFRSVNKHSRSIFYMRSTIINNTFNKLFFLPNLHVSLMRYDLINLNVTLCIINFTVISILKSHQEYLIKALSKIYQKNTR